MRWEDGSANAGEIDASGPRYQTLAANPKPGTPVHPEEQ